MAVSPNDGYKWLDRERSTGFNIDAKTNGSGERLGEWSLSAFFMGANGATLADRIGLHPRIINKNDKEMRKFRSLRDAIATICKEEGWLIECFKMVHQPNCLRKWCFTNGTVCFEIDTRAREVNYYRTIKFWATPAEIVGIE